MLTWHASRRCILKVPASVAQAIRVLERPGGALDLFHLSKAGAMELPGGALDLFRLSKTGALERLGGALESVCLSKTGGLEPHPVWGFKNINP